MDQRAARTNITADWVLQRIAAIAAADPRKLLDAQGQIDIRDLPDDVAAAITGIAITPGQYGDAVKVTLADRLRALELLGRHLKLFTDKLEVEITDAVEVRLDAARKRLGGGGDDGQA